MPNQKVDFTLLENELPPVFARCDVGKFLGGLISPAYLANLDCLKRGPKSIRIGRKVGYFREDFLEWLVGRSSARE